MGFAAAVDCWGGRVVLTQEELTPKQPVAPLDYTADLSCPLLGLFGADDRGPTPEQVARHEPELKKYGKLYEFHMYPGAGHGFFYYDRPNYRQEQAVDGWSKIFAFLGKHLGAPAYQELPLRTLRQAQGACSDKLRTRNWVAREERRCVR